jgi:hypothetical protein
MHVAAVDKNVLPSRMPGLDGGKKKGDGRGNLLGASHSPSERDSVDNLFEHRLRIVEPG